MRIIKSDDYDAWFCAIRDAKTKARIAVRIERLALGNPGDVRPIGEGLSELRLDFGPGYRIYFARRGAELIVLLGGGDKATQTKDIKAAKGLWAAWKEQEP